MSISRRFYFGYWTVVTWNACRERGREREEELIKIIGKVQRIEKTYHPWGQRQSIFESNQILLCIFLNVLCCSQRYFQAKQLCIFRFGIRIVVFVESFCFFSRMLHQNSWVMKNQNILRFQNFTSISTELHVFFFQKYRIAIKSQCIKMATSVKIEFIFHYYFWRMRTPLFTKSSSCAQRTSI